jgi:preprotein translocase subunit Sec61beta
MAKKMSRRKKRRQGGGGGMPMGGAGLIRFFEDTSIGIKISPIAAVLLSAALIGVVIMGHFGIFEWLFSPAT